MAAPKYGQALAQVFHQGIFEGAESQRGSQPGRAQQEGAETPSSKEGAWLPTKGRQDPWAQGLSSARRRLAGSPHEAKTKKNVQTLKRTQTIGSWKKVVQHLSRREWEEVHSRQVPPSREWVATEPP